MPLSGEQPRLDIKEGIVVYGLRGILVECRISRLEIAFVDLGERQPGGGAGEARQEAERRLEVRDRVVEVAGHHVDLALGLVGVGFIRQELGLFLRRGDGCVPVSLVSLVISQLAISDSVSRIELQDLLDHACRLGPVLDAVGILRE